MVEIEGRKGGLAGPNGLSDITFVIPFYNSGAYIGAAVDSIRAQTALRPGYRIVIVDDGSSDPRSLAILAELKNEPAIDVLTNARAKGPSGARNTGLLAAATTWIAFLDADDLLPPDSLQKRLDVLDIWPDAAWIGGDYAYFDSETGAMEEPFFHSNPKLAPSYYDTAPRPKRFSRPVAEALEANITITSTILVRRALCLSVGMFDEALRQAEDYHLWIKLAAIADFVFVPEVVMHYRQHSANTTKTDAPRTWTIKAFEALLGRAEFAPYRPLIRRRLQRFHIENARFHRNGGMSRKAFGDAWGAVRLNPFSAAWKEVAAAFVEGLKR